MGSFLSAFLDVCKILFAFYLARKAYLWGLQAHRKQKQWEARQKFYDQILADISTLNIYCREQARTLRFDGIPPKWDAEELEKEYKMAWNRLRKYANGYELYILDLDVSSKLSEYIHKIESVEFLPSFKGEVETKNHKIEFFEKVNNLTFQHIVEILEAMHRQQNSPIKAS